jgi:hypothetical protein
MRRFFLVALFACLMTLSSTAGAKACSKWSNWDIRGTFTMVGSGWVDLSKLDPSLPPGTIPMSWAGVKILDGKGSGSGWVVLNAGGVPINVQLVNLTYAVQSNCSVQESFSMVLEGMGKTIGPVVRLLVIGQTPSTLELRGMFAGSVPGGPVDVFTSQRISMETE